MDNLHHQRIRASNPIYDFCFPHFTYYLKTVLLRSTAPTAPTDIIFTQVGTTFLVLTWPPVGSSTYDIRVLRGNSVVQDMSNRRSPLTVQSLAPGVVYKIGITSVGDNGVFSDETELYEQATRESVL